uniref:Reverse transcriptase domain-containing protein n=1 Tax=Tanacetum cinerariifolium TaxID=118510 RepID=A0A6L2LMU6_TANCI|nr:reverse transcriptase domain-containing protein [Tanacetum cinerariifolium]
MLLTKTPKEIFALEKGKFKSPLPMTTSVEKQNHAKFCKFHDEVGHNTDECMHLKKQIKEILKAGKLLHLIKELKQNNGKEQPKAAKKGETSVKDKALAILMESPQALKPIVEERFKVEINPEYPEQTIMIGFTLTEEGRNKLCNLLQHNLDIFAWKPADMTGTAKAEEAFKQMKQLIVELLMLTAPVKKEELIVYLAAAKETVSVVLMTEREAKQMPIYFVSRTLRGPELNYTSMEKLVLALVHIKEEFSDTLMEVEEELPEPWILFTDRSSYTDSSGAGLILTNPEGVEFTYALRFRFDVTNNEAEYEALIAGLRIAEQMGVENLQANVDSRLVANQVNGTYVAKEVDMICYLEKVKTLTNSFKAFSIRQVPRSENKKADTLSKIASTSFAHLNAKKARAVRRKSWRFAVVNGTLYKKIFPGTMAKAVIPTKIGMPTLRTAEVDLLQNNEALEINLDLLEERREEAAIRKAKSKAKMEKYYNSKVQNTSFKLGDLVYRNNDASRAEDIGKLGPKWEGPYEVTEVLGKGAYKLRERDGKQLPRTWNISNLKKCYVHKMSDRKKGWEYFTAEDGDPKVLRDIYYRRGDTDVMSKRVLCGDNNIRMIGDFGRDRGRGRESEKSQRMKKQHGLNILAVEVQIEWLWTWLGRGWLKEDVGCDRGEGRMSGKGLECEKEQWKSLESRSSRL